MLETLKSEPHPAWGSPKVKPVDAPPAREVRAFWLAPLAASPEALNA